MFNVWVVFVRLKSGDDCIAIKVVLWASIPFVEQFKISGLAISIKSICNEGEAATWWKCECLI